MLTVEYTMREFLNSVTIVKWEWILAAIILIGTSLGSRLAPQRRDASKSRSHETHNPKLVTRNP